MRRSGPRLLAAALLTATLVVGMQSAGSTAPSPTGAQNGRIVFTRCRARCQLYTVNPDGTALRRIRTLGDAFFADWSPDGEQIVYASTESGDTTMWIVNGDGSDARQLTPDDPDYRSIFGHASLRTAVAMLFTSCLGARLRRRHRLGPHRRNTRAPGDAAQRRLVQRRRSVAWAADG